MDTDKLNYFRGKLNEEREHINHLVEGLYDTGDLRDSLRDSTSELSSYDNHPADIASETFEIERNRALRANEITRLRAIDSALKKIDDGTYGICGMCGREIDDARLEAIPSAALCIDCETKKVPNSRSNWQDRPIEETVMGYPFGSQNRDPEDYTGYDGEDTWQELESYNSVNYMLWDEEDESMQGVVEETDKISNEQYRRQLPD
jgi:YteA family regulatory protein